MNLKKKIFYVILFYFFRNFEISDQIKINQISYHTQELPFDWTNSLTVTASNYTFKNGILKNIIYFLL